LWLVPFLQNPARAFHVTDPLATAIAPAKAGATTTGVPGLTQVQKHIVGRVKKEC